MVKVIGLMELNDQNAFEQYRSQVSQTVELHEGSIKNRGAIAELFWNELGCATFSAFVELEFPSTQHAHTWTEYQYMVHVVCWSDH